MAHGRSSGEEKVTPAGEIGHGKLLLKSVGWACVLLRTEKGNLPMHFIRNLSICVICLLAVTAFANATQNNFGVADSHNLQLTAPTWVGGVLLPQGNYTVQHTMDGQNHIMVFKQLKNKKPAEARANCQLVPLTKKAAQDELQFSENASKERVLHTVIFRGDSAQHVF